MKNRPGLVILAAVLAAAAVGPEARAQNVWLPKSGTNDWHAEATNWSLGHFPLAGEEVVITNRGAGVVLSAPAPDSGWFGSVTLSNAVTLVFTNWTASLGATNAWILNGATGTCAGPFSSADGASNRVHLACSNLFIGANAGFNVSGRGYAGGSNATAAGSGPGRGLAAYQGGGHGGQGQTAGGGAGGAPYGDAAQPTDPGSGGYGIGGHGGGAVRIDAQGLVTVNGTIAANGLDNVDAPGSGGSVWITCRAFAGSNGFVSANGGGPLYSSTKGGGGGGRIAVAYDPAAQAGWPAPGVVFSAAGGRRNIVVFPYRGDLGTLWFPDAAWLLETNNHSGRFIVPGLTNWSGASLTVTNGWIRFEGEDFRLAVTGALRIGGPFSRLEVGGAPWTNRSVFNNYCNPTAGPVVSVGGSLALTNGGALVVYSGATNGTGRDCGARLSVAGAIELHMHSWILPTAHPADGGAVLIRAASISVAGTNAGVNASGRGWPGGYGSPGYGPGAGTNAVSGAGHGGLGIDGSYKASGFIYGASNAPVLPGSGGAGNAGVKAGNGGGVIRLEVDGTVWLNGTLNADAMADGFNNLATPGGAGAGSGGSIWVTCRSLGGTTNGVLSARGGWTGSSSTGAGGGGRIALFYRKDASAGAISNVVTGGKVNPQPQYGQPGTVVWKPLGSGSVMMVR